ncbi:hypothetical protein DMI65_21220 [Escherichia coli]|nr:hypothetical protein [Escherichia coli]
MCQRSEYTTGYADTRVETETGLQYTFNETVCLASELLSRARFQYG